MHVFIDDVDDDFSLPIVGDVADDAADSGNPLKIGFRAVDSALSELSAANDRADGLSDIYRRQYVNSAPNVGSKQAVISVDDDQAYQLDATPQSGRVWAIIQNLGSKGVYLGNASVSNTGANRGLYLPAGATEQLPYGEHVPIYAYSESGAQDIMLLEVG
jgi:hypothetical protein